MKAPKCRQCGTCHWSHQAHAYSVVANTAPSKVANRHGQYADKDKRRVYMREYMRQRRAGTARVLTS